MHYIVTHVAWSVCMCVSVGLERLHCKTAEPIEVKFGLWTRMGAQVTMYWVDDRIPQKKKRGGILGVTRVRRVEDTKMVLVLATQQHRNTKFVYSSRKITLWLMWLLAAVVVDFNTLICSVECVVSTDIAGKSCSRCWKLVAFRSSLLFYFAQ